MLGWDTLCPFLLEQADGDRALTGGAPSSTMLPLPKALMEQAQTVATYLESDNVINALASHPRLVTLFQPDVVVLQTLDRLTATLPASKYARHAVTATGFLFSHRLSIPYNHFSCPFNSIP
jgi:hypothetical protein